MHATSATGSRGFTLLELLVVLTIMVLIACAWPLASSRMFITQRLRNELQQLAGAIRVAQVTARATGAPQELNLSSDGTSYSIGDTAHELPGGLTLHMRSEMDSTPAGSLVVYPDGSSTGAMFDLSAQEHLVTLRVSPLLGRLEMPR
jgi:general secretion pathway protein H